MKTLSLLALSALFLGIAPLHLSAATRTDPATALCPVCRVHEGETETEEVRATAEHAGETYGFCSEGCRETFLDAPEAYLPAVFPRPAPAWTALGLDGAEVASGTYDGKLVLLDFWATWCPPCIEDLPRLSALHDEYSDRGFAVVGLSIDEGDDAARKVERMMRRKKASHPVFLDRTATPAWAAYLVRTVPAQFLVDPDGQIVAQWLGRTDLDAVEEEIRERLPEPDGGG